MATSYAFNPDTLSVDEILAATPWEEHNPSTGPFRGVVLARKARLAGGEVVLVKLDTDHDPFVTWVRDYQYNDCSWGHYYSTFKEALADFNHRS